MSNYDPTLKSDFSRKGYTSYKNKVYNRLKKGTYIKRDRNMNPLLDENGEVIILDWNKQSDLIDIQYQKQLEAEMPPGGSLAYIKAKIIT